MFSFDGIYKIFLGINDFFGFSEEDYSSLSATNNQVDDRLFVVANGNASVFIPSRNFSYL